MFLWVYLLSLCFFVCVLFVAGICSLVLVLLRFGLVWVLEDGLGCFVFDFDFGCSLIFGLCYVWVVMQVLVICGVYFGVWWCFAV